jgi:hypothetical protein
VTAREKAAGVLGPDALRQLEEAGLVVVECWQPIETAPKDGTFILACWRSTDLNGDLPHVVSYTEGEWRDDYGEEYMEPTHWMPLPDPPAREDVRAPDGEGAER